MRQHIIRKTNADLRVAPNLAADGAARAGFSWDATRRELAGLPGGGLNIAHEAVDRHAAGANAGKVALRWLPREGAGSDQL